MHLPEKKAEEIFLTYGLPAAGEGIVIGVSGGADSVALLRVMAVLAEKYGWRLCAVHVEHGIRGEEALADARWVESLCENLHVSVTVFHEDIPAYAKKHHLTEEEAGRAVRYRRFYEVLESENAAYIAVAHNANDNAETMLLALARGTGIDGLRGIPPVRDKIIRPLIKTEREEITAYLQEIHQDWREDATNASDMYARNRVRLHVLPELRKINSSALSHMNQSAEFLTEAAGFIGQQAKVLLEQTEIDPKDVSEKLAEDDVRTVGAVSADLAKESSSFLRREVLHLWVSKAAERGKDITSAHIYMLEDLLLGQAGRKADLPYGLTAVKGYETLQLLRYEEAEDPGLPEQQSISAGLPTGTQGELLLGEHRFVYRIRSCIGAGDYSQNTYTKSFDYDKIKNDVSLRYRLPKDRIMVNAKGEHQSLKKYFINAKVPQGLRGSIPVFACENEILWITGGRISEICKVDSGTRTILEIQENKHE